MIIWKSAVLSLICMCFVFLYLHLFSALSMFHIERRSRNTLIIIIIIYCLSFGRSVQPISIFAHVLYERCCFPNALHISAELLQIACFLCKGANLITSLSDLRSFISCKH